MKRGFAFILAVLLLVVAVTPAFAAGKGPPFALVGRVTEIVGEDITVELLAGNRSVRDAIGTELTILILTNDDTIFRHFGDDLGVFISLEDVAVGQIVSAHGAIVDGDLRATRVVIDVPWDCPQQ